MVMMARKGEIGSLGTGDKKTNPIYEGDLAKVAVQSVGQPSSVQPIGGRRIYTHLDLVQLACKAAGYSGSIRSVPFGLVNLMLPLLKLLSRNLYDKVAFLVTILAEDCIAPQIGDLALEEYFGLSSRQMV